MNALVFLKHSVSLPRSLLVCLSLSSLEQTHSLLSPNPPQQGVMSEKALIN